MATNSCIVLAMGTRYKTDIELPLPFENLTENIWFTKAFEFSLRRVVRTNF